MPPLQLKKRIIAASPSRKDMLEFLTYLADSASDIRTPLPAGILDSLDVRKAISSFILENVDEIKRIGNNTQKSSHVAEDD